MDSLESRIEMIQLRLVKSIFEMRSRNEAPQAGDSVAIAVSLKNNGEFARDGRQATFIQRLQTLELESSPFHMDIEFAAAFHLEPPPLPLAWPNYVRQVFPRMVFPHLRDYVAELTRRGGFSPLNLNQNLFDDEEARFLESASGDNKWIH